MNPSTPTQWYLVSLAFPAQANPLPLALIEDASAEDATTITETLFLSPLIGCNLLAQPINLANPLDVIYVEAYLPDHILAAADFGHQKGTPGQAGPRRPWPEPNPPGTDGPPSLTTPKALRLFLDQPASRFDNEHP